MNTKKKKDTNQCVFFIHSNITYLSSLAIIEAKNIQNPKLIFGRNFKSNFFVNSYEKVYLSEKVDFLSKIPTYGKFLLFFSYFSSIQRFNKILKTVTKNNSFTCYIPHTKNFLMQLLINHKNCIAYNILDEGLLSYTTNQNFIKKTNAYYTESTIGIFMKYLKFLNHFNKSDYYNYSKKSYNYLYLFFIQNTVNKKVKLLKLPKFETVNHNLNMLNDKTIFILDDYDSNNFVVKADYLKALTEVFTKFKISEAFIKIHPATKDKTAVFELFKSKNISVTLISDAIPIEVFLVYGKNISVYGFFSSLLFYASIFNQKSYSLLGYLKKQYIVKDENLLPEIFYDKVKII